MIEFEKISPKEWNLIYDKEIINLQLTPSSVTNKFFIITDFTKKVSECCGEEFDIWFTSLLRTCEDKDIKTITIANNIPILKQFVNNYLSTKNTDFSKFVDETKAKKNSILFTAEEIEKINKLSSYLKIYAFISNNTKLKLGQKVHTITYNKLAEEIAQTEIIFKIFNVIRTKVYRYNLSDRYMWEYIKNIQCKDIGVHVIEIFNFIMNHILILCEEDRNPIIYFVSVINESVKWFLRSVYKGSIVYDDSISTEDIQGINVDNLNTYSYNDTLGRLKSIAYEKIYEIIEKHNVIKLDIEEDSSDDKICNFHSRISEIKYISPLCESLVFPVLSKITKIPYYHFKTLNPEHSAILSIYVQNLLQKVFEGEYKNLFNLLGFYPLSSPSTATTYKIKSIHEFIKTQDNIQSFYKFNTKILPHKLLCYFVGRVSRINFCHIVDGHKMGGIPLSKVETDMIYFYSNYFAEKFENQISQMVSLINQDF